MSSGLTRWIELQSYLPLLLFYAAGIGAAAGDRYRLLKRLFETRIQVWPGREEGTLGSLLPLTAFSDVDSRIWNEIAKSNQSTTPVSHRALQLLQQDVPDLAGAPADFEHLLHRFEILAALSRVHQSHPGEINPGAWFPFGPYGYRIRRKDPAILAWFDQADSERDRWPPIAAGLFGGSYQRFDALRAALMNYLGQLTL
jgi:hypothetical protein